MGGERWNTSSLIKPFAPEKVKKRLIQVAELFRRYITVMGGFPPAQITSDSRSARIHFCFRLPLAPLTVQPTNQSALPSFLTYILLLFSGVAITDDYPQ